MTRKRKPKSGDDPFKRACSCGAGIGEGCRITGNNSKPLITRATRLVHADRLQEGATDA